ncbi:hypothetical protein T09_4045 [Trichinella sp. T9]|nr:hypothetical protein T09_4045 [Trichinella sp. T9]
MKVLSIFKTRPYQSTAALLSSLQVATCAVQLLDKTKMTIVSVSFIAMNFEQWHRWDTSGFLRVFLKWGAHTSAIQQRIFQLYDVL